MLSRCGCDDGQAVCCCRCRDTGTQETPVTIDNHRQRQDPPGTGWRCGDTDPTGPGVSVGLSRPHLPGLLLLKTLRLKCGFWSSGLRRQSCTGRGQLLWKECLDCVGLKQLKAWLKELPSFPVSASSCGMTFLFFFIIIIIKHVVLYLIIQDYICLIISDSEINYAWDVWVKIEKDFFFRSRINYRLSNAAHLQNWCFSLLFPSESSSMPVTGLLSAASAAFVCGSRKNPGEKNVLKFNSVIRCTRRWQTRLSFTSCCCCRNTAPDCARSHPLRSEETVMNAQITSVEMREETVAASVPQV